MADSPIEGQIVLLAGAKASVPAERLPALLDRVQADLESRLDDYRTRYEVVEETDDAVSFFVETDHWDEVGARLGFDDREADAVRRAHHEQIRRAARRADRADEIDAGFEIRAGVVIGR